MFGLGIFDYIKIGLFLVIISIGGYYVWNYHHMKATIIAQQAEIGGLKEGQRVLFTQKEVVDKYMAKVGQAKKKVTYVEGKVDAVPSVPDAAGDALVLDLLKPYGLHDNSISHPPVRGQGSLKPAPRPRANPAPH